MRRVVVTGLGLITPLGTGVEQNWTALTSGTSGVRALTAPEFEKVATRFAGVADFDPKQYFEARDANHMDRFMQLGIIGAQLALEDAGYKEPFDDETGERVACYVGAGIGGLELIDRSSTMLRAKGPRLGISPFAIPGVLINLVPGRIAIRHNILGPVISHVSACSTGAHAIGEAMQAIRWGVFDVAVTGGSEAAITPLGVGAFASMRALSARNDEPQRASRPFDRDRDGFVMGEGAGVIVLEELERAKKRGARIYAELTGYAATSDAHHITVPAPEGAGAQRSMRAALKDAKLAPDAIGYVNAHGTSTRFNDVTETVAVKRVFGEHAHRLAMSSTKSMTAHLLGAAGGVEAAYTALAIARNTLPPTINLDNPDPECDLDYVAHSARGQVVEHAMTNSFGFGGTNATLVLSRFKE